MKLSVVIVSYNVKHLLEQCLHSVMRSIAGAGISSEVIVVDNNSADGTPGLASVFPGIRFIANKENLGFAKACNQGYALSGGKMVLFLNPDTIIDEKCLEAAVSFLEEHAGAGAAGVRMINEKGEFLKESKRGFPSPAASFFRLFGFAALFPRSKVFARYYMGHLSEFENHETDVLSGAFMMIKREVLEKTGGFDEKFFMYGEDVDLSYRIQQEGYKNYYLGEQTITHFKGQSTDKSDLKYVKHFYRAMSIFAEKHFKNGRADLYFVLLRTGIFFRMLVSLPRVFFRRITGSR